LERLRSQLSQILETFQVLREVDTEGVEPTGHAVPLQTVLREDEPRPPYPASSILANAPREQEGYFRVKAVLQ
jgi:aspartyl-tRNA(Asn)/glutamyl-tRNA(Gln) amidotransferase subunit C